VISVTKILFPADFSDRCRGAAHAVRAAARRFNADVVPLHVVESVSSGGDAENLLNAAHQQMERLMADELGGCKVRPCVTTGEPAVRIMEHAHAGRFDLIMMPTHGFGPFRRFLLGSVTAKVLHDACCPVWTSAHLEDWAPIENVTLANVLCGIDFGSRCTAVLKCASQVATEFSANLALAHAIPLVDALAVSQTWRDQAVRIAENRVRHTVMKLRVSGALEIVHSCPAFGLGEIAERLNADLIVIGRTHMAADVAKLGSNAYAIIAHSPCPVLSV
jgi:nucleotide-binding universal stress UspA family protein